MTECNHNCGSCGETCSEREKPASLIADLNEKSHVKHVIAVVSGKGGVGKSLVTSLMSAEFARRGHRTAILDADITGPSIPQAFGIHGKCLSDGELFLPAKTKGGIDLISLNMLLEHETDPVMWRGPLIAGVVKQFWTDVFWDDVDYMFVDMPPGTGDVPLTVFQSLPVDGVIVVTSPQDLVSMIVKKAVNMAKAMNIPVLGIVENMSYFVCPDCNKKHYIYGESHIETIASENNIKFVSTLPIDPNLAKLCDEGKIEDADTKYLSDMADYIEKINN
ncbi:MAG: Mrp/NBP35 family ATP-binding protein [Oscillospiraceae bacterium]